MKKILIATTNPGKFEEYLSEFGDLPIKFVSLRDVKLDKIEIDEPYDTLSQNAIHKARFYARKSGLITIAEDAGFFIDQLQGAPGIKAKRYAETGAKRNQKVLENLLGVPERKRGAFFQADGCVFDPITDSYTVFTGKVRGRIAEKIASQERAGLDYDAIFYFPPLKKIFSELTILEKNNISHRGQVIHQIKYFLSKHFSGRQCIASAALVIKDRKVLFTKRRDHRPEFDGCWEFPGGMVEFGEDPKQTALREGKEETGLNIQIFKTLPGIYARLEKKYNYQVFIILYLAKYISGKVRISPHESSDFGWFDLKSAMRLKFLPLNKKIMSENLSILKQYID
ncbi:MAG: non-canonical purine NTP pyrophosphatase [Candidatus Magasanikbacteria bacterium]